MANSIAPRIVDEGEFSPGARLGRVRWTICAMLFVATSINYMDRQVLSLLKPILMLSVAQHGIGMTEVGYGYIMAAFQIAYAIGLLAAGRFVDKVGTRIGYMCIMAVWSLSAMGHALVNSMFQFGIARVFLGLGESGNFPAAIKTVAEWFPQSERSLATGIFNSGANMGAILAPLIVPWVALHYSWHAAFLVTGLFSALWILLWFSKYRKPADHPTLTGAELRHIYREAAAQMGPSAPWRKLLGYRQTWAFAIGKLLTDPIWWFFLFWLPDFFSKRYNMSACPSSSYIRRPPLAASAADGSPFPSTNSDSPHPMPASLPCSSVPAPLFPSSSSTISIQSLSPSPC
jgi:ACS family hexuronate transporter-like MFS transporter